MQQESTNPGPYGDAIDWNAHLWWDAREQVQARPDLLNGPGIVPIIAAAGR